jgi:hypothetical protein
MNKEVRDKLHEVLESVESDNDLLAVNDAVISYINERRRIAAVKESLKYKKGDRVTWNTRRRGYGNPVVEGTVMRVNQKTLSIDTDEGKKWRVPYTMVKKV